MAHFELEDAVQDQAKIKVIGVGGAGGNAVNTMIQNKVEGVEFYVANTDVQALERSLAPTVIQLGRDITRGLGAGANPEKGREAALESVQEIAEALRGADMVFVTAGMGGGTGTGAAPIIAQVAREMGALTVGVVTKPFRFEGKRRMRFAEQGIEKLEKAVDTLITIPNDRLLQVTSANTSLLDSFRLADEVLQHATQGVSDLITVPGIINVDFADVRTIMSGQGRALMGMGIGHDEGRALAAAQQAISSPLLEDVTIHGAQGILINITAGPDLKLHEVEEAASYGVDALELWGPERVKAAGALGAAPSALDGPFRDWALESLWGGVWTRPGLSHRDRSLLTDYEKYWRILIADRRAYTAQLRTFDLQPYYETLIDGGPVSNTIVDFSPEMELCRMVKTPEEIRRLKTATAITVKHVTATETTRAMPKRSAR